MRVHAYAHGAPVLKVKVVRRLLERVEAERPAERNAREGLRVPGGAEGGVGGDEVVVDGPGRDAVAAPGLGDDGGRCPGAPGLGGGDEDGGAVDAEDRAGEGEVMLVWWAAEKGECGRTG